MSIKKQGGSTTNDTGNVLENFVDHTLLRKGYEFIERSKFILAMNGLNQKLYTHQLVIAQNGM